MEHQDWKSELPEDFSGDSRVWIYQSDRPFRQQEIRQIRDQLHAYCAQWISHNRPVRGWASVLFDRFIVFMADDTMDRLCGSAVDGSIRFVKDLEGGYQVRLLDRTLLAFLVDDHVEYLSVQEIPDAIKSGRIGEDTLYFNNTVTTRSDLEDKWIVPVKESWLGRKFHAQASA